MATIDISQEVEQLQTAVYGEEVRGAFISCMEKLYGVVSAMEEKSFGKQTGRSAGGEKMEQARVIGV